ncbi:MAG: enoyl-CoA hydratase/isomerase family protein [Steroidobacteraceae bacterium]|nr:enoyl-CoA hydratase/isomerase family protein [Steroidobacteraceae bacterium]
MTDGSEIVATRRGVLGLVTLERPAALNALTTAMVEAIDAALTGFEADPGVHAIVLRSASTRAFCAGGDMRRIRALCLAGDFDGAERFFAAEFALNRRLAGLDRPIVALVDGICMGGGLGLSVHGRFRVATEHAVFAMPETALGYFPDVGGSHFLPRLPAGLGRWLGLTGARLDGAESVALGLATHLVPRERIGALLDALASSGAGETCAAILDRHAVPARAPRLEALAADCAATFGVAGDRQALVEALQRQGGPFAAEALAALARASPHSLDVTLALFATGQWSSLAASLEHELAAARAILRHPDFVEGVRAVLVDKTREAHWQSI